MHVTCGTDIELTCPIRSLKQSNEVVCSYKNKKKRVECMNLFSLSFQISWFRPNSSKSHLTFIAIGDILFPEYASLGRFNVISSRLSINNVVNNDQGIYTCKSSSSGQHSIKLSINCMYFC